MRKQKSYANTKVLLICHSSNIGYKTIILYQKKRYHFLKQNIKLNSFQLHTKGSKCIKSECL